MYLAGMALAITGGDLDVSISVTSIEMEELMRDVRLLSDHCYDFDVNIGDKDETIDGFIRVATSFNALVKRQVTHLETVGTTYRPVVLILGDDGRKKDGALSFDDRSLAMSLFNIPEQFRLQRPDMGPVCKDLANSFRKAHLTFGHYGPMKRQKEPIDVEAILETNREVNRRLSELKLELDSGSEEALSELIRIAGRHAIHEAKKPREAVTCWSSFTPLWKDYATRPDLQEMHPSDAYLRWHPDIYEAFITELKAQLNYPANMAYQCPTDTRQRLYQSPLEVLLHDQFDVARGRNSEHNISITERPVWRGKLIERFAILGQHHMLASCPQ